MSSGLNRRAFLGSAIAGGMVAASGRAGDAGRAGAPAVAEADWPRQPPVRIHKVYIGRTGRIYLSRPKDEIAKFEAYLADLEKRLGDVEFVGGEVIPPAKAGAVVANLKGDDAVLMFHLSHGGAPKEAISRILETGLPAAVFTQPFSGHWWMYFPQWQKQGKRVILMPSGDWSDLDRLVRLLRVPVKMKRTRLIAVGTPKGTLAATKPDLVKKAFGTEMLVWPNQRILEAHKAVPIEAAEAEAQAYWLSKAKKIVEPTEEQIVNSARMYLAVKDLMIKEKAQAITSSHCMGKPAKGCLTFSKLNDLGKVGACEGDVDSTLTMLMFQYAFGIPGFISDPVFDVSENALIHFHCTSATCMDGPGSKRQPFTIRTQSDSEKGVSLEVEHRIDQEVTCAKLVNLDTMLISTGKIYKITRDELACRTQFWTKVEDADAFYHNWGAGKITGAVGHTMTLLHRVVFYGNHVKDMERLGRLMGFKVLREG